VRGEFLSAIVWPLKEVARALVLLIDWVQRKLSGIVEFSHDPDCIARIGASVSRKDVMLPDGTQVKAGERLGEIHLWNEKVPEVPPAGPDMAWGLGLRRKIIQSLKELATYVGQAPEFAHVQVFHGGTSFMRRGGPGGMLTGGDLAVRLGFHVVRTPPVEGGGTPSHLSSRGIAMDLARSFRDFWENLYYLALVWTFNPRSLRTKGLGGLARVELYMTRETLMTRYGALASRQATASRK